MFNPLSKLLKLKAFKISKKIIIINLKLLIPYPLIMDRIILNKLIKKKQIIIFKIQAHIEKKLVIKK